VSHTPRPLVLQFRYISGLATAGTHCWPRSIKVWAKEGEEVRSRPAPARRRERERHMVHLLKIEVEWMRPCRSAPATGNTVAARYRSGVEM
jgi:hypothetical protein